MHVFQLPWSFSQVTHEKADGVIGVPAATTKAYIICLFDLSLSGKTLDLYSDHQSHRKIGFSSRGLTKADQGVSTQRSIGWKSKACVMLNEGPLCSNQLAKSAGNTENSKEFSVLVKQNLLKERLTRHLQEKVINRKDSRLV